jgi:arabinofuranan 3-O-arabinosyltransferase
MAIREAPPHGTEARGGGNLPRGVEWGRHFAVAMVLATLAFMQEPGRIVPDTKIDLPLNPAGLLQRALELWEPLGFGGQVQNQGYGYLFPMGPYFLIGNVIGVPEWIWQRLWWSLILFAAYLGAYLLAKALGIGSPATRLVGALAFALAPRMVSTLGAISSETLAMALAPWVVLPLVWAARDGRLARGGLLSGVALLFAGGVNAAATLVLCIPAVIYLLTRSHGRPRRQLALWWGVGAFLASAWWLGPLLILRQVSPPFLDYIEDAAITTRFSSLPQVIRGTDHWIGFLADTSGPVWPSGWFLVTVPIVIIYTAVVAALGLAGVSLRSLPERTFVASLALVGIALLTFGYVGAVDGLLASWARSLLDGPFIAFRNTHKFDPVLRMALALGLAHLLARLFDHARGRQGWGLVPIAVSGLALLGVAGTAFPAYVGQLASRGSFVAIPGYWEEAVEFLEGETGDGGRVLLVPGTSFANYLWGAPRDEPIQALGSVPWMVRDAIPLTPPATIRMLDALQARWASGRSSPGMADQLAAAGVKFLLIRNDLDTSVSRAPTPTVVHEALRGATGLRLVADFGPLVGGQLDDGAVVDRGLSQPYRAIEVFEVEPYAGLVSTSPLDSVPVVAGGQESIVDLRDAGVLDAAPALLDGDEVLDGGIAAEAAGPLIATDGVARRESTPGRVDDNMSNLLTIDEAGVLGRKLLDYEAFVGGEERTVAQWTGEGRITASSAASQVNSVGGTRRSAAPGAALDGDLFTAWWSAQGIDDAPWWMVEWPTPRALPALRISIDEALPLPRASRIKLTTSTGEREYPLTEDGVIDVPASGEATTMLRIDAVGAPGGRLGIREIFGLAAERRTAVVPSPSRPPAVTALSAAVDGRPWCVHPPGAVICTDLIGRAGEEDAAIDRIVSVPAGSPLPVEMTAVPRPGSALDAMVAAADARTGASMTASASSSVVADPEGGPRAAIDRDLETAWIAGGGDRDPRLALQWGVDRSIGGLQLRQRLGVPASRPLSASVRFPDGEVRSGDFDERGILAFDVPVRASSMVIRFPKVQEVFSVDPATASGVILPVGVADLRVLGTVDLQPDPTLSLPVDIPCGEGPVFTIGDTILPSEGTTTVRDLVQRLPAAFVPCGDSAEGAVEGGRVRILATGGDRWSVQRVLLGDLSKVDRAPEAAVEVLAWGATNRQVMVAEREGAVLLVVRENANPGWEASINGEELPRARPDGWQQGWVLPPGEAVTVQLTMRQAPWYRAALLWGLACVAILVVATIVVLRRSRSQVGADRSPVIPEASIPLRLQWAVGAVVLVIAAGVWGGIACGLAWVLARWLGPRTQRFLPMIVGGLVLTSGLILAAGPWPSAYSGDSLAAGLAATFAVALAALPRGGTARPAPRSAAQGLDE